MEGRRRVEVWKEMVLRIQEACSCLEAKDRWRKGTEDRMAEGLEEEGGEETEETLQKMIWYRRKDLAS